MRKEEMRNVMFKQAKMFVYRNARPLELARWKYLLEGGKREDVMDALSFYQNDDGGFGHGLEPDCLNPNSSPMQTWQATQIIRELSWTDATHPLIQGILSYLASKQSFYGLTWQTTIPSNDAYPHAPWWSYEVDKHRRYHPTVGLYAFIIRYANRHHPLYEQAKTGIVQAYAYFKEHHPLPSTGTAACFMDLYEALQAQSELNLIDLAEFKNLLSSQISSLLTYDITIWDKEYVCKPSLFIHSLDSEFYPEFQALCQAECDFIQKTQQADGTWKITWAWENDLDVWQISKNWWKSAWIIAYLNYYQTMRPQEAWD